MKACFTGYRPDKLPWARDERDARCGALILALSHEIEGLYARGCREFVTGCAEGIDTYCAELVLRLKARDPGVVLECAVPYPGQENRWEELSKERYRAILKSADFVTYVSERYYGGCMMKRNRYMVDGSDVVLAVFDGKPGGTANTVDYAKRKGRELIFVPLGVTV